MVISLDRKIGKYKVVDFEAQHNSSDTVKPSKQWNSTSRYNPSNTIKPS